MNRTISSPLFGFGILLSSAFPCHLIAAQKIVTAAQVNGTWSTEACEFQILALGKQRLQIDFSGTYSYQSSVGPMANTGEASGIGFIEGDTATFKPEDAEADCQITLKFVGDKLIVTELGSCGFGLNVTSTGTYRKTSNKKPALHSK